MEHTKDQIPFLDIVIKRNKIHCNRNIPFCLVKKNCTIAENNEEKFRNWEILKSNLSKYHSLDSLINPSISEGSCNTKKDAQKHKKSSNKTFLPYITTFNAKNSNIHSTIKPSVNCSKSNNVSSFHNVNLI